MPFQEQAGQEAGPPDPVPADPVPADPVPAVEALIGGHRPRSRRLRRLIALLTGEPMTLASLVRHSSLPRQTVEEVLSTLAGDLVSTGGEFRIETARVPAYRQRFGYDQLVRTEPADPLGAQLAMAGALEQGMAAMIAQAPPARTDLDHVPATPETAVRRALWLDSHYDLAGSTLLFVGDHDLTSLAAGQVSPEAELIVVDIDEPTLEFIDDQAGRLGISVRCLFGDLRFGLPARAAGQADLVFTDPPYTPEGVELFTTRGLQGLKNRDNGSVIVAYGYSDLHPTLGFQVQSAAHRLGLAYEAVVPQFNRYQGAQAIGSSSDLYVWRPTSRTWRSLDRLAAAAEGIYTRGSQAVEARTTALEVIPEAVLRAADEDRYPVSLIAGPAPAAHKRAARLRLATLFTAGVPATVTAGGRSAVVDLRGDPGGWLLRALLAVSASRAVLLVPNSHPDLASGSAQQALAGLLQPKYRLRFLRSQPDARHAIVVADRVAQAGLGAAGRLAARLLTRAHGKVGNVWREGLIEAERERTGASLSKRDARARAEACSRQPAVLDTRLIELPRHQITRLLADVAASVPAPG